MESYWDAGAGLKKMFIATIGAIICSVLLLVPDINIFAAIAALVFSVLSVVGMYQAGKDIEGCKRAFVLMIVRVVVRAIGNVVQNSMLAMIFTVADTVLDVLVVYYVCTSVSDVLERKCVQSVADKGRLAWKINLACEIVMILFAILAVVPSRPGGITLVVSLAAVVLPIIALIIYVVFLYQSSNALQ